MARSLLMLLIFLKNQLSISLIFLNFFIFSILLISTLIKTAVSYHFTSTRKARNKKSDTSVGKEEEKLETSYIAGRM